MIRIIEGGFFSGAHDKIKNEIRELVESGRRVYLLVPEQQAVLSEAEMAAFLPPHSPLFFEVTNFTRLANTVFRSLGGADVEYCDGARRSLIMWRAITELSATLSLTGGKREVNSGLVERAMSAVRSMESAGLGAAELADALEKVPEGEGRLYSKLADLSAIMSLYKQLLHKKFADVADDIVAMTERLKERPDFFDGAVFYVEGFTSFTEPQYSFIALLAKYEEVNLHLCLPHDGKDAFEYTELREAEARLIRAADKCGAQKQLLRLGGRAHDEQLSELCDQLWRTGGEVSGFSEDDGRLRIFACESPYEECDLLAADVQRRVMEGASYRDFAVVARRAEDYLGILDVSLESAGIPHFISKRREAASFEAIKLILTAFSIISGGYRREDVISYAKCSPCGISREACDEFELYTELWQINGRRFTDGEIWNMNPDGYTTRHDESQGERLIALNETRRTLIEPLVRLESSLRRAHTVEEHAKALFEFLVEVRLEESIKSRADELIELGEGRLAAECATLWQLICDSLDTLVSTLGESAVDIDGFLSQLKVVFAAADMGRIPSYYDALTVGSADMLRLFDKKHIYLIGVNRGEFPLALQDDAYFTDRDKATLSSIGLSIEPDSDVRAARELFCFSRAFACGKQSVTILYSERSASLKDLRRAEAVDRIIELTGGKIKPISSKQIPAYEMIYSPEMALGALGKLDTPPYLSVSDALHELGRGSLVAVAEGKLENDSLTLSEGARSSLFGEELHVTQTRLDAFNSCPLLYFCRYSLSLSPVERAEFDARNIGSFVHAILESFFKEVRDKGLRLGELGATEREEMVRRGAEGYLSLLDDGIGERTKREQIMLERLSRATMPVVNSLCDEFGESEFIPRYFELEIKAGAKNLPEPLKVRSAGGRIISIHGTIDRVDTYTNGDELFVRVIDYKTGHKEFKPSDIDEGKNLQMFLYLKAIVESKNEGFLAELGVKDGHSPVPAGVTYVKTELGDVKIDRPDGESAAKELDKAQARVGMMLYEDSVIAATGTGHSPIKLTKDGTPYAYSLPKLYSREGWDELSAKLERKVGELADKMTGGSISATPLVEKSYSPCTYCEFKPFCRRVRTK